MTSMKLDATGYVCYKHPQEHGVVRYLKVGSF